MDGFLPECETTCSSLLSPKSLAPENAGGFLVGSLESQAKDMGDSISKFLEATAGQLPVLRQQSVGFFLVLGGDPITWSC